MLRNFKFIMIGVNGYKGLGVGGGLECLEGLGVKG